MDYFFEGDKICRDTFLFMHGIFKDRLMALMNHYQSNGVTPRVHGNKGKQPSHALTPADCQRVVDFIFNYAEEHAVLLPGRIPGYKRDDMKLLPSSELKASIYRTYQQATTTSGVRSVAAKTFNKLWQAYCPNVLAMKPRSDLCWTCQQNSTGLLRSANLAEDQKSAAVKKAEQHLNQARAERSEYQAQIKQCKEAAEKAGLVQLEQPGTAAADCSRDIVAHYSFDFAQQLHFPSNPLHPGPIYFKTPRKCGVFGVMTEALPQMVLFLIDESVCITKGANCVISLLDYFFLNFGLKEKTVYLHADNCSGQNKNNAMLHYLLWRVMTGRHDEIQLSFLLAGHTKFAPDWCFGLFKRHFRKTQVDCLADISSAASACSSAGVIVPQLCGTEDGTVTVPTYHWDEHLGVQFNKLPGIKKYHHFTMQSTGRIVCREFVDSPPVVYSLVRKSAQLTSHYPAVIQPPGLSSERQAYLYREIREFVGEEHRDLVCPRPSAGVSKRKQPEPTVEEDTEDTADVPTTSSHGRRQRGRPRKPPARGRGRPRKN